MNKPEHIAVVVGAYEAKSRLSALLDRVENGQEVVITRHGRPVARLVSERPKFDPAAAGAALERLIKLRKQLEAKGVWFRHGEIHVLLEEDRRFN